MVIKNAIILRLSYSVRKKCGDEKECKLKKTTDLDWNKYKHYPHFIVTIPESRTTFWSISFSYVLIGIIAGQVWLHGKGCRWEDVHRKEEVLLVSLPARSLAGPEGAGHLGPWEGLKSLLFLTLPLDRLLTGWPQKGGKDGVLGAFKGF